jgi:FkbM family methyltransferase
MVSDFGRSDQEFLKRLRGAEIELNHIYDVGASNGQWSWMMAQVAPGATFDLFEPNASDQYAENLKNILVARPDFRMHRVALGETEDTLPLNLFTEHFSASLLDWDDGTGKKVAVPVRCLDKYIVDNALPMPDVIKMDTQGYELRILEGAQRACARAKALIIETWLYPAYGGGTPLLGDIIEWLEPRGFILTSFGDSWTHPDQRLFSIDAYFLRGDVAVQVAAAENAPVATD